MPQTTPPISWLCDAFGLMILPQAVTSIARVTRIVAEIRIDFHFNELRAMREQRVLLALGRRL